MQPSVLDKQLYVGVELFWVRREVLISHTSNEIEKRHTFLKANLHLRSVYFD
jgi:hypothetical protein